MIEETDEEYRSNDEEEVIPDFEGLRQFAISDEKQERCDDEQSEDMQIKEIKLNNRHSKALMSTEYDYLKRDPEEEFFMLAVLALKMVHNEEYEEAEYVY